MSKKFRTRLDSKLAEFVHRGGDVIKLPTFPAIHQCQICSRTLMKNNRNGRFCSKRCRNKSESVVNSEQSRVRTALKNRSARKLVEIDLYSNENKDRWLSLRYEALRKCGRFCALCNVRDVELHVDHIKPKSKYPELAFNLDNLQVLCRDCNYGKSNIHEDDWR